MIEKAILRKQLLQKRNALDEIWVQRKTQVICQKILDFLKTRKENHIVLPAYAAFGKEADLSYLFQRIFKGELLEKKITLALPRIWGREMKFFEFKRNTPLERSSYGILEPGPWETEIVPKGALVLVPGVGFHKNKQRLGYGAGFYDAYFNLHRDNALYGVAFAFQCGQEFETRPEDIAVRGIFTEQIGKGYE